MEIGFGRGKFISKYAKQYPDRYVAEVRRSMVDIFNERYEFSNLKAVWGTVRFVWRIHSDGTLSRVFIFHPDPWFKKRHYKRRVLNQELLGIIQKKVNNEGIVYISTDVQDLFIDMKEVCSSNDSIEFIENDVFWSTDYMTHWSMFSEEDQRDQYFLTIKFKE